MLSMSSVAISLIRRLPLGKDLVLRIWNRVVRVGGPRWARTYFGAEMLCDPRDIIQASILHFGVWEPALSRLLERTIRPGDVVADLGANVGYFSLLAAHCGADVVAVEALALTASKLSANVARNKSRVRIVNAAVSDHRGTIQMFAAPAGNIGMSTSREDSGYPSAGEVQALTLLDILTPEERRRLAFVKCDIEGAEVPVVRHLLENLAEFGRLLCFEVEVSPNEEWKALFNQFIEAGFQAFLVPNNLATSWHELLYGVQDIEVRPVSSLPSVLNQKLAIV